MQFGHKPDLDCDRAAGKWAPPVSATEVQLAAGDFPMNKAAVPGKIPAEFFRNPPALSGISPALFTQRIEGDCAPREACCYHILPCDKAGKDSSWRGSQRPISSQSPFAELLERIVVRRLTAGLQLQ